MWAVFVSPNPLSFQEFVQPGSLMLAMPGAGRYKRIRLFIHPETKRHSSNPGRPWLRCVAARPCSSHKLHQVLGTPLGPKHGPSLPGRVRHVMELFDGGCKRRGMATRTSWAHSAPIGYDRRRFDVTRKRSLARTSVFRPASETLARNPSDERSSRFRPVRPAPWKQGPVRVRAGQGGIGGFGGGTHGHPSIAASIAIGGPSLESSTGERSPVPVHFRGGPGSPRAPRSWDPSPFASFVFI
jgi:hypothetical protein